MKTPDIIPPPAATNHQGTKVDSGDGDINDHGLDCPSVNMTAGLVRCNISPVASVPNANLPNGAKAPSASPILAKKVSSGP